MDVPMDQQTQASGLPASLIPPEASGESVNNYYPPELNDGSNGLPISLDSLRDGPPGSKPFYPYSTLIRYAIKGSPNQKLLLEDIYYAIESRFPYFRSAPSGWKNSVRHNLSLNPCFQKLPRPLTDRGKGSYWIVNDNVDPRTGVHRVRKKKKGSKAKHVSDEEPEFHAEVGFDEQFAAIPPAAPMAPPTTIPAPEAGTSQPNSFPHYPPAFDPNRPFDPNFAAMLPDAMRYAPFPIPIPQEYIEMDASGNPDWRMTWLKELDRLRQATEEQDKNPNPLPGQEWYKMMFLRVRAMMMEPMLSTLAAPGPEASQQTSSQP